MALKMLMITFQTQVLALHDRGNLVVKYGSLNENDLDSRGESVVSEATPDERGGGGGSLMALSLSWESVITLSLPWGPFMDFSLL